MGQSDNRIAGGRAGGVVGRFVGLLALAGSAAALNIGAAQAQTTAASQSQPAQDETNELPPVEVTSTRLVRGVAKRPGRRGAPATTRTRAPAQRPAAEPTAPEGGGTGGGEGEPSGVVANTIITGASSTVITSADIARSPSATLQDILAREPGIQIRNLSGAANGAQSVVDVRGFGMTAANNTLVLINGRRLNDIDLAGVDFSAIPKDSIERIEISRGNSGAVLYGDGAVGGVINIVTKAGFDTKPSVRVQGTGGSYNYFEGSAAVAGSAGNFSASAFGNAIDSDGYRQNNRLQQSSAVGDLRWTDRQGTTAYLNISGDDQHLGLPGGRSVNIGKGINEFVTDPRGAATPFDFADKQGASATLGFTRVLTPGTELIVDGGVRQKYQQAAFFSSFGSDFDSALRTTLTTYSLTPRLTSQHDLWGMPGKLLTGIDIYDSVYGSDRGLHLNSAPNHRYDLTQTTVGGYFMETVGLLPTTDFAFGGRLQWNNTTARDSADPNAPGFSPQVGTPLDDSETQYAFHVGIDHRLNENFALFARAARSFRLPTVDERVGIVLFGDPTNFDLKTQTSHDVEGGIRMRFGSFSLQTSAYYMWLTDELFYSPVTSTNINLDPTKRYGVENVAAWQATDTLQFKASLTYTRSVFREGPLAGNDVPMVSRWTGSAGVSWNIYKNYLVFDAAARFFSAKRMDNDALNQQVKIPGNAVVDVRLGGQYQQLFWSFAVQNLFDLHYYDYAVSAVNFADGSPKPGEFSVYPLPGRTFLMKVGTNW